MNFLIKDDDGLLKKYTDIWNKVGVSVKQKLNWTRLQNETFENQNIVLQSWGSEIFIGEK